MKKPEDVGAKGFNEIFYTTHDGLSLKAWYRPATDAQQPVMVLFHGNADIISNWGARAAAYAELGIGVMLIEYRGYGGNPGKPTETDLLMDADAAIAWLGKQGIAPDRLIFYGHSLGSGVATAMAAKWPARALLLEAPYYATVEVAAIRFPIVPVQWLMHDRFLSGERIKNVKAPVTIVHGTKDRVIPLRQGEKLSKNVTSGLSFHVIEGGSHIDLYEHGAFSLYQQAIMAVR